MEVNLEHHGAPASSGHEETDANVAPIIWTLALLAFSTAFIGLIIYGMFNYLAKPTETPFSAGPMMTTDQTPPEPRISEHPAEELKDLNAREDQILSTYGWVNKQTGVVRVPIDRAIDLTLQHGLPVRPNAPAKENGKP